jgi:transcriptional regulator with XRE-family HTH domain
VGETFGIVLRDLRKAAGLSLRTLANRAHCSHSHIADMEKGRRQPGPSLALQLDDVLAAGGQLARLAPETENIKPFGVRSHKFVVSHLGPEGIQAAIDQLSPTPTAGILPDHWSIAADDHPAAQSCTLHLWAHGVTIHHLVEEGVWPSLTTMAQWRYATYERDLEWASQSLTALAGRPVTADYVLSAYWVTDPAWTGERLDIALRLMCMPRVLVGDDPSQADECVEMTLLRDGFLHPDIVPFGVADTAIAYASWSGVVYRPLDEARALRESDLVEVELATQALWNHCSWLARQVECGQDPAVSADHGWRWVRASRSRLFTARPQETGTHRSMREAILSSSGLPGMLEEALTTLRETAP